MPGGRRRSSSSILVDDSSQVSQLPNDLFNAPPTSRIVTSILSTRSRITPSARSTKERHAESRFAAVGLQFGSLVVGALESGFSAHVAGTSAFASVDACQGASAWSSQCAGVCHAFESC